MVLRQSTVASFIASLLASVYIIQGNTSSTGSHQTSEHSDVLDGGVLLKDDARLKEMLHWSEADELALLELPSLGDYWSLNKTARLNDKDGLACETTIIR